MAVGPHLDLGGREPLARDLDGSGLVEGSLQRGAVGLGQGPLHVVHARPESGPEDAEAGDHRPGDEPTQALDVLHVLHVQLVLDLGLDGVVELDAGVHEEGAPQRLAGADLGVGSGGPAQGHEGLGRGHLTGQARVGLAVLLGPVGEMHRLLAGEPAVQLVGEEGDERRQQLGRHDQGALQGGMGGGIRRLPEARPRAADVPVRQLVDEAGQRGGTPECVERLQARRHGRAGALELVEHPAVEHVAGFDRFLARRPSVDVRIRREERPHVPQRQQRLACRLADALGVHAAVRPR